MYLDEGFASAQQVQREQGVDLLALSIEDETVP